MYAYEGAAGKIAASAALKKDGGAASHGSVTGRITSERGCLKLSSLGTPPSPICPKCAKRLGHPVSTRQPKAVSGEEDTQVLGRTGSLGPQNGPEAIYKADGMSPLEARPRTHSRHGIF